jgi:hypothetical protein
MKEFLRSSLTRVWVPVLGLAGVAAYGDRRTDPGDLVYFVHRGEQLLSGGWASTFADPHLQSGPLQLLVFGAVRNTAVLAFAVQLTVAAMLLAVLGKLRIGDRGRLLLGLAAVAAGLTHIAFVDGHPAEAITPLLWVIAALWAREDRVLAAGGLLGVSAGLELWGVLGAPVLLLAPRLRRAFAGGIALAAVVIAQLAPFALAGTFRMFSYHWAVAAGTPASVLVHPGTPFGWPFRLLQASLALGAGAAAAVTLRRSVHALWLAPLAVALVRILLDPVSFGWYWLEVEALVLVGAGLLLRELPRRFPAARLPSGVGRRRPEAAQPPSRF